MTKYSAIYYPDCYINNYKTLTTYLLLYDELHFIALSDDATNPTDRFRKLPKYTVVTRIWKGQKHEFLISGSEIRTSEKSIEIDDQTKRTLLFYQFVQRYKILIGDAIFFHPHLLSSALNRIKDKLLRGELEFDELIKFFCGEDEEIRSLVNFQKEFPTIRDEVLWRIVPTAMKLAKEHDLLLVSDKEDVPVPFLSTEIASVKKLTSILAEECVNILVPSCREVSPEEILEIRQTLNDLLIPFRISLQRLSKDLRDAINSNMNINEIRREAKFIVESQVEPAVFELKKRIETANSKLFNKVFGKILSWIPFVAKAYALPTPDNLLAVAKQIGADSSTILDAIDDLSYSRNQGLCFLLKAEEVLTKNSD